MSSQTFTGTIVRQGSACFIPLPFDPKAVFGRTRVPVRVTINGHTFPSTIASMGGPPCIPLRKSNQQAAGVERSDAATVVLTLDSATRTVLPPGDLVAALTRAGALERWQSLAYTHQREHVDAIESARKPETRARRIERAAAMVTASTGAKTTAREHRSRTRRPSSPRGAMTEDDFRRMALALSGTVEGAHMGHADFRAQRRIFATMRGDDTAAIGMVKLTPEQQARFIAESSAFTPESGAWGRQGCTRVMLASAERELVGEALTLAWQNGERAVTAKKKASRRGRT